jgi:hypothetical protein
MEKRLASVSLSLYLIKYSVYKFLFDPDGLWFRVWKSGGRTYQKEIRSFKNNLHGFRSPVTVSEYLDKWLETAAKGRVRTRTFTDYSELLARHVRPTLGAIKLTELRPLDIQALYTKMQDNGLSPRTIRYVHAVLSSALKQA